MMLYASARRHSCKIIHWSTAASSATTSKSLMRQPNWNALTTFCLASTMNSQQNARISLKGVVFDMDGTLTVPNLDFGEMYRRCDVPANEDILQVLALLPEAEAKPKYDVILEMEAEAVRTMQLLPGAVEVMSWLQSHKIPIALVTRNTLESAQALQQRIPSSFDAIIARDSQEDMPPKPNAAAMNHILEHWNIADPASVVMVGDSPSNDIVFGKAAGTGTVLLDTGRKYMELASGKMDASNNSDVPDIAIDRLYNLARELWLNYDIDGDLGTHSPLKKYPIPQPTRPATIAAAQGDLDGIIAASDYHSADESGNTPLIWAADAGHFHIVKQLVAEKVDLNVRGFLGATAACRAARKGHVEVIELLLEAGADFDIANDKMQYPLHFAAFKEMDRAVDTLLASNVNTRVLDRKGRIPALDTKNENIRNTILASMEQLQI